MLTVPSGLIIRSHNRFENVPVVPNVPWFQWFKYERQRNRSILFLVSQRLERLESLARLEQFHYQYTARARVSTKTSRAPPCFNTRLHSFTVAPEVYTSSTSSKHLPFTAVFRDRANAPRMFFLRSSSGNCVCGGVSIFRKSVKQSSGRL